MKVIDVTNPQRVNRLPDRTLPLFSSGDFTVQDLKIKKAELRLYIQGGRTKLDSFTYLITSFVETDKGSIEMKFEEGKTSADKDEKPENAGPIDEAAKLITSNLGISALILRSVIELKAELEKPNT